MDTLANLKSTVIGIVVLLVLPALAQAATQSAISQQTTVAAVVQPGDQVVVNSDDAPLMVGRTVLARLPIGQTLTVAAVKGPWLGTHLTIGGESQSGWVSATDVMLARTNSQGDEASTGRSSDGEATAAGPRRVTAFRPITGESEPPAVAQNCPTPARRSYGPGEWDYYWTGHHEPDPNIHAWEPWRHQ